MGKRNKQRHSDPPSGKNGPHAMTASHPANPPVKNPTLLAVSIVLFALWFAFLIVTALVG
jgi:hypothetical protein